MTNLQISHDDYSYKADIIAQDDDNDYSESGWVCVYYNDIAYLGQYSHCSCYGTYDALSGQDSYRDYKEKGTLSFNWSGSLEELKKMAQDKLDPDMPDKIADSSDYDFDHLMNVYDQLIEWFNNRKI